MPLSKAKRQSNRKYDAKAYDTLGAKTRKGVKDIVGIIADKNNMTVSEFIKRAISEYIKTLEGSDILTNCAEDIDTIIRVVHRPDNTFSAKLPYVYEKDYAYVLDLRNRAEEKCVKEVISEAAFKAKFKKADKVQDLAVIKLFGANEWYWADEDIYDVLYTLVYQANK
ncbi:MAG: hypothetical protein LUD77_12075 [Clostridiales bacterium]|nr:hypothetical protein [Clostridiales bacterium]